MNTKTKTTSELRVLTEWMEFLKWLLPTTEKFPKKTRFTLTNRIDNLALDLAEQLVEARYTRNRRGVLHGANLTLSKMRILLRVSHDLQFLAHKQYEHASRKIDDAGRMIGAWEKSTA